MTNEVIPGGQRGSPADTLRRQVEADLDRIELDLPVGAIQLLYDVLGHFPHDPGAWHMDARARCSVALMDARDQRRDRDARTAAAP